MGETRLLIPFYLRRYGWGSEENADKFIVLESKPEQGRFKGKIGKNPLKLEI